MDEIGEQTSNWFSDAMNKRKEEKKNLLDDEKKWRDIDGRSYYVGDVRTDPDAQKNWKPEQSNTVNFNGRTYTRAKNGYYYNPEDTEQVRDGLGNTVTRPKARQFSGYTAKELTPHKFMIRPRHYDSDVAFLKSTLKESPFISMFEDFKNKSLHTKSKGYDKYYHTILPQSVNEFGEDSDDSIYVQHSDRFDRENKREKLPFTFDQIMNPAYKKQVIDWIRRPGYDNDLGYKQLQDAVRLYHDNGQAFGTTLSSANFDINPEIKKDSAPNLYSASKHQDYDEDRGLYITTNNGYSTYYYNGDTNYVPYPSLFDFVKRMENGKEIKWHKDYTPDFFKKYENKVNMYRDYIKNRRDDGTLLKEVEFSERYKDGNGNWKFRPSNIFEPLII